MPCSKWILLMTHGPFGRAIVESAAMIAGPMEHIYPLALMPGMSVDEYMADAARILDGAPEGSYILVDMYGGTPSNVASMLMERYPVQVYAGLNLTMLISLDELRQMDLPQERLDAELMKTAADGIRHLNCQQVRR